MGKDKAMLKVDGVTLFDRVLHVMEELFTHVLIAGGDRICVYRACRIIPICTLAVPLEDSIRGCVIE
jgi:molybdopterin-guanine dinucleotide biosynthesis protein A